MNITEQISIVLVILGGLWIALTRSGNDRGAVTQEASQNLPWYLDYNTLSPLPSGGFAMQTIPTQSTGIQNDTGTGQCTACTMFGLSFGSQY